VFIVSVKAACLKTDCAATNGCQKKLTYSMNFPRPPIEAALSIFNFSFLVFQTIVTEGINENKGDFYPNNK
jgi:hypothetical protein